MAFLATCALAYSSSLPSVDEIVSKSCQRETDDMEIRKQYTFRESVEVRKVDKSGNKKDVEIKTFDVFYIDGTQYKRMVAKNGRPLTEKEEQEQKAKLDREIEKHRRESESERRKRREKDRKDFEDEQRAKMEIPKAFRFTLAGEETVQGRPCWKLKAEPNPAWEPRFKDVKVLPKVHGTLWVDKEQYRWAKLDIESLDTITAGLGFLRVGKGARMMFEQAYINNELWAPVRVDITASARALFVVGGNFDVKIGLKDYRKFSVSSTVTAVGEDVQ